MKLFALLFIICASISGLPVSAQDSGDTLNIITPESGSILNVKLSPDGEYLAIMTIDPQGEPSINIWRSADATYFRKLMPDLTIFVDFFWSPNSQYIAATGNRGNASGNEYGLYVYDILDEGYYPEWVLPRPGRYFGEFIPYEESVQDYAYEPVWSTDSRIIAVNFRDGIHFYDITDCTIDDCNLLYVLDIGYVAWFDWQGSVLITESENTIQMWDVSSASP